MSKLYLGSSLIQTTAMGTTAGNLEMWSPPPPGTITIDGNVYQFDIGMTWEQWCASSYNTTQQYVCNSVFNVYDKTNSSYMFLQGDHGRTSVKSYDTLIDGAAYRVIDK